ncbi:hypothetical protein CJ030_MR2G028720 [Morella rubra]|uniref:RNase H type-1 domain-containing protein n=1 Tax=Morella rubra TaxID=262757 RepID=A0A6A1WAW3_9ROSI|nr:hypothetical protein CJ030_MR2G028720 [Morella rubra]
MAKDGYKGDEVLLEGDPLFACNAINKQNFALEGQSDALVSHFRSTLQSHTEWSLIGSLEDNKLAHKIAKWAAVSL